MFIRRVKYFSLDMTDDLILYVLLFVRFHIFFLWAVLRWLGIWKLIIRSFLEILQKEKHELMNLSSKTPMIFMFAVMDCSQSCFFYFYFFKMIKRQKLIPKRRWVFYLIKYEGTLHFLFSNNNHIKFWSLTHLVNHNEMKWALALYKKK